MSEDREAGDTLVHWMGNNTLERMTALDGDANGPGPFRREVLRTDILSDKQMRQMWALWGMEEHADGFWYRSATEDRALDRPAIPRDEVHDRAYDVARDLLNGRVTQPGRRMIRDALDKADAAPAGRAGTDQALGRAIR